MRGAGGDAEQALGGTLIVRRSFLRQIAALRWDRADHRRRRVGIDDVGDAAPILYHGCTKLDGMF